MPYDALARRVRVAEIIRASTYRQHYFTDRRARASWRSWLAGALLVLCLSVLIGEVARWVML